MRSVWCFVVVTFAVTVASDAQTASYNTGAGVVYDGVGRLGRDENNVSAGCHGRLRSAPSASVFSPLKSFIWSSRPDRAAAPGPRGPRPLPRGRPGPRSTGGNANTPAYSHRATFADASSRGCHALSPQWTVVQNSTVDGLHGTVNVKAAYKR